MKLNSIDKPNEVIAKDTGLHKAEISMALNAKRLLGREKLRLIVEAGYPLEPFVFGKSYLQENDTPKGTNNAI